MGNHTRTAAPTARPSAPAPVEPLTSVTPLAPPAALGRRLLRTAVVLVILAALAWPVRTVLHRVIAEGFAESPLAGPAGFIADKGLLVIVAVAAVTAVWTFRRDRPALLRLFCGGVGVVLAYLTSELVKMVVTENRPCAGGDVTTVLACPTGGDWSWPSNHSVIAAAIATACVLALPWQRWFVATVCTLAGVEAFSRVAAGVHYAHDALSGLALGLVVVTLTVIVLVPPAARVVDRTARRRRASPRYYE
jgi:membrane-associated phospholipid phosphatase